jgi:hypothetical protein
MPRSEADLRFWLENMIWYHRFDTAEIAEATGLTADEIDRATARFGIAPDRKPIRPPGSPLLVLPYPGGRHPRVGFLEGAVRPQRETKFSVFAPWDDSSYAVADIPEAIWSDLGLIYLAHTHARTLWTDKGIDLPQQEWNRGRDGTMQETRALPNGIEFGVKIVPAQDAARQGAVRMEMWLKNGTPEPLGDLRVQNCIMLKGLRGFEAQTGDNKVFEPPFAACRSQEGDRWIVTAWTPHHRSWGNPPCPCLHSDPKFPDCPPGETRHIKGWLSFYEGQDLAGELERIGQAGWIAHRV